MASEQSFGREITNHFACCGAVLTFISTGCAGEREFRFCPYCGRPVEEEPEDHAAGNCTRCGGPVYHRPGAPGEFDHECTSEEEDDCTDCCKPDIPAPSGGKWERREEER